MNIKIKNYSIIVEDRDGNEYVILDGDNTIGNISDCTLQVFNDSVSIAEKMISIFESNPFKTGVKEKLLGTLVGNCIIANHLISKKRAVKACVINNHNTGLIWNIREVLHVFNDDSVCESVYDKEEMDNKIKDPNIIVVDSDVTDYGYIIDKGIIENIKENKGLLLIYSYAKLTKLLVLNENVNHKEICLTDSYYIYYWDFKNSTTSNDIKLENMYHDYIDRISTMNMEESTAFIESLNNDIHEAVEKDESDIKIILINCREQLINHIISMKGIY